MSSTGTGDVFKLAGATLESRFEVDRLVAEGGFGVVYHATQAALDRPIALKVLKTPPRFDDEAKQHFLAGFASEAKTIARIAHPNIVQVFDFGVSVMPSGVRAAWMALEWLTGATLEDELLRRRGRGGRSPAECLAILRPVLSALAVVHAAGVAHRDLKPANIMVVPSPGGPVLKLLDFGIAKIMHADEGPGTGNTHTRSNQIAFSPGYASPEQISNGRSGPWTDVHAMGLTFTELLTDRAALEGSETALLFQQILDRVRPSPAKYGVSVGAWEAVLCKALSVATAERYRDAAELLRALEATVADAASAHSSASRTTVTPAHAASSTAIDDTLQVMPTEPAPSATALSPQLSLTTTGTPTSEVVRANRRSRASLYFGAAALALATMAGIGWRAVAMRAPNSAPSAAGVAMIAPSATTAAEAPSATAVETSAPPLASNTSTAGPPSAARPHSSPTSEPAAAPDAAAPRRTAPRPSSRAPQAAPSAVVPAPAASGRLIIE